MNKKDLSNIYFFGTFDPINFNHTEIVKALGEYHSKESESVNIYFALDGRDVSGDNYKPNKTDVKTRVKLIEQVIETFKLDDTFPKNVNVSTSLSNHEYTFDTIKELESQGLENIYVLGEDNYEAICNGEWTKGISLLAEFGKKVIIVAKDEGSNPFSEHTLRNILLSRMFFIANRKHGRLSSTQIRKAAEMYNLYRFVQAQLLSEHSKEFSNEIMSQIYNIGFGEYCSIHASLKGVVECLSYKHIYDGIVYTRQLYSTSERLHSEFNEYKKNNRIKEYLQIQIEKLSNYFEDTEYTQAKSVLKDILCMMIIDMISNVEIDGYEVLFKPSLVRYMNHKVLAESITPQAEIISESLCSDSANNNKLADDMISYLGVKNMDIDDNPYYYISEDDMVAAIVYDEKHDSIILSSQKRPYASNSIEPAGGKIDKGESPMSAIIREVEEELQLDLSKANITFVSKVNCAPGLFTSMTYLYWISIPYPIDYNEREQDADENVSRVIMSKDKLLEELASDRIFDVRIHAILSNSAVRMVLGLNSI